MARYASIDIGTNSVLLLVAEATATGFRAVAERAEITRLGRGVDKTRRLEAAAIRDTVDTVTRFASEARNLGAEQIVASATSAARDAINGPEFLTEVRRQSGVEVEIISGELEARLSFAAVTADFLSQTDAPLVCVDIGGGSTEIIYGGAGKQRSQVVWRHSFDVGSVRLTERFIQNDPPSASEERAVREHLRQTLSALPPPPPNPWVVGVAGTVTTLFTLAHEIEPYDAERVQGGRLTLSELQEARRRLFSLTLEQKRALKGLQPKRADVIAAGALILEETLLRLGAQTCVVSDRGLRWGLLVYKFGAQ